ncbi:MAG: protein translocase subunit SecF [Patescibacteria group bacterium]
MFIVKNRIAFYILSILLIGASIVSLTMWGLNQGIDFKGGSSIELQQTASTTVAIPATNEAKQILEDAFPESTVRAYGEKGFLIKTNELTNAEQTAIKAKIGTVLPAYEVSRFDTIGPVLGAELKKKSVTAIVLVLLAIVLFITFAFRQVSRPVASWKYGIAAIVALFHDVIVPMGFFSVMAHFFGGYEVDALFITALLVVLGFSIHDTIVVFDRVRENLSHNSKGKNFEEVVGDSVSQTFVRSINTSLTTIFALVAVYVWGPETTRNFALALIVGIVTGTYSSIFIGSPLLVTMAGKIGKKG